MTSSALVNRIKIGTSLEKALYLIASEYIKEGKSYKYLLIPQAQRILLRCVAPDPNRGWDILRALDRNDIYGERVAVLYGDYYEKDLERFIAGVLKFDPDVLRWLRKQRDG